MVVWELLVILVLILINGFFAGAEIAVLTARRGRLEQLAGSGNRAARIALDLAGDPNRFLPTVQVGITLVGTFAAAFGGARVVEHLARWMSDLPLEFVVRNRQGIALVIVALAITFFSLVLGELVPKRLALRNAERLACLVAYPLRLLGQVVRPVVWFLGGITNIVLVVVGGGREPRQPTVSLEDIQHLIDTGTAEGILEPAEQRVAIEALRLGERNVQNILKPRVDIEALDVNLTSDEVLDRVAEIDYSRIPVYEQNIDRILGIVSVKELFRQQHLGLPINLRELLRPVLYVPETLPVDRLLDLFRHERAKLAVVLDEYGGTEGIVTLEDVLDELVGEIRDERQRDEEQAVVRRDETSWLVAGSVNLHDLVDYIPFDFSAVSSLRGASTVAGLVLTCLDRVPNVGDQVTWQNLHIEVVDMDGPRIDRLLIRLIPESDGPDEE